MAILCGSAAFAQSADAALIAYWNFNSFSVTGTVAPSSAPNPISADSGSGSINIGSFGGGIASFGGSTLNALNSDVSGNSLSLVAGVSSGTAGNNTAIFITTNTAGKQNIAISFAGRGTSTGFNTGAWAYSTDNGANYTSFTGNTASTSTTYAVASVAAPAGAANASSVIFRYTVSGATSTSGNNRIDNLQINGDLLNTAPTFSAATYNVTVDVGNRSNTSYGGSVALAVTDPDASQTLTFGTGSFPAGFFGSSFTPSTLAAPQTNGASQFAFSVLSSTPNGTYTLPVTISDGTATGTANVSVTVIPEPASLVGAAGLALGLVRRRSARVA
ncbi:MAG: hypothetical protein QM770_05675 [Tepidisphaeraceae bacterium]